MGEKEDFFGNIKLSTLKLKASYIFKDSEREKEKSVDSKHLVC